MPPLKSVLLKIFLLAARVNFECGSYLISGARVTIVAVNMLWRDVLLLL